MRIEISAGGIGGSSVTEFQTDLQNYMASAESVISSFKAIKSSTCNLNGGVGALQGALDEIDQRITEETNVRNHAQHVQSKADSFIQLAERVDKQVAADVNKNKDELYRVNPWLRPSASVDEDHWYEKAWNWLCDKGEQIADGLKKAWDWTKDTAKKAWKWAKDFYEKHWYDIVNWGVTILCAVGSIVAIALIPVTGGASILLVAGVSALSAAIVAATRSITTQQRDKGSVDWGEVGKEAAVAALVGAVTGAIGAGVGGAIASGLSNTGLGATLLNSSSTAVRMITGAVIGSASEVASGMLARGAAEATQSYIETGSVDFGDVWDAAADPQQMFVDAAIGGATGGFSAKRDPIGREVSLNKLDEATLATKPKNSPNPQKWIQETGGKIYVDGNGTWTYQAPDGVHVCYNDGYANFKRAGLVNQEVNVGGFSNNRPADFARANKISPKSPTDTWHHYQDGHTLQAVDTKYHDLFRHRGGFSIVNGGK